MMAFFSAEMIVMVVLGHTGGGTLEVFSNWFPIASFHMPAFVFASGYFYKKENADRLTSKENNYIWYKMRTLLKPYFLWNLFYGILLNGLRVLGITGFGEKISIHSLLIEPWISGHQFGFNCAAWFVTQLFLIQILYAGMQKVFDFHCKGIKSIIVLIGLMLIGNFSILVAEKAGNGAALGDLKWVCIRTGFLMPFYHLGYLYKNYLEERVKKNKGKTVLLIFVLQFVILAVEGWDAINYSVVSCIFHIKRPWILYIAAMDGIIFWLLIADLLVTCLTNNKIIHYISENIWTIMMHHITSFWILNSLLKVIDENICSINFMPQEYYLNQYYMFLPFEQMKVLYVLAGIAGPLGLKYLYEKTRSWVKK